MSVGSSSNARVGSNSIEGTLSRCGAVFVQPHLDDVGLSCGGAVARAADAGAQPVVVGVFASTEDADVRDAEDARACAVLGAVAMRLGFRDAPDRGHRSVAALFRAVADDDPLICEVAQALVALWQQTPRAAMYLPLGVGGHVDHAVCYAAGGRLEAAGVPIRYYEDYPYVAVARARREAGLVAELVDVTPWIERRVRAAEQYASQAGVLARIRRSRAPLGEDLRRYAAAVASEAGWQDAFAERFYRRDVADRGAR